MNKQWARWRALQPDFARIASQVAGKGQKELPINTQLAQFRREQIKPASTICSAEVPLTSQYLFGDELAKQLRHARESSKISRSVGHSSQRRPYTGKHRSVLDRYGDFLWKGQHRSHRKKKPQINEKKSLTNC